MEHREIGFEGFSVLWRHIAFFYFWHTSIVDHGKIHLYESRLRLLCAKGFYVVCNSQNLISGIFKSSRQYNLFLK